MQDFHLGLASISFLILVSGLVYKKIKESVLSEPMIAIALGILLGPEIFNLIDVHSWGKFETILEIACQLTISMALMATAFRVPKLYLFKNYKLQSILIFGGMLGMCLISSLLIQLIFGYHWLLCFLIGAIITPTDPVVSSTIVAGETARKLLPDRIRQALTFESGANDGLAYPLVLLPLLLITKPDIAIQEWVLLPVLWETGGSIAIGLCIGYFAGKFLVKARNANWMSETALLSFSLALGFFVLGFLELIHSNGILGVFAAAFAANLTLDTHEDIEQEKIQEAKERIFTIPIFVIFGLLLPWSEWWTLGWKAMIIIITILFLRRLPVFLLLKSFNKESFNIFDIGLIGWFGPIGIAALYYMAYCLKETGMKEIWIIGSLIVFGSTIVHGFTSYPLAKLYNKKIAGGRNLIEDNGER